MSAPETPVHAVFRPSLATATLAIFRKELRVFFLSPLAYVFLSTFLFLGGLFFYFGVSVTGEASLRPLMGNLGVVLLFCIPMVTTRQLAEETRVGTVELLFTTPISLGAIILGKWLATVTLCAALLLLTGIYPIILGLYGEPDPGVILTSYLGLLVCCGAFSAAGLFTSSMARDQMVAGVTGILVLLPFWVASAAESMLPEGMAPVLQRLSFLEHMRGFAKGVLDTGDLAWFAVFTAFFLVLTWRSLESRRWR